RAKRARYLQSAVGRARVHDDDLALGVAHQRHHAFKRAPDVSFLVVGNDDDRERHAERITRLAHLPKWRAGCGRMLQAFWLGCNKGRDLRPASIGIDSSLRLILSLRLCW